jgi:hypothetical protein
MPPEPRESDWKVFRRRVPEWRERYLVDRVSPIAAVLTDPSRSATERFWEAKAQIDEEARILVACLDGHSRSSMLWYLVLMYRHGMITASDLGEFTDGVREHVVAASGTQFGDPVLSEPE